MYQNRVYPALFTLYDDLHTLCQINSMTELETLNAKKMQVNFAIV